MVTNGTPNILISLGSFHKWLDTLPSMNQLDGFLRGLVSPVRSLDGVEFQARFSDIDRWAQRLKGGEKALPPFYEMFSSQTTQGLLALPANCVHLDPLSTLEAGHERWLAERLTIISDKTGITDFTVHPDSVDPARWEKIIKPLPEHVYLSVENMDFRKENFRTLVEVGDLLDKFPTLRATFDVCHWIELGNSLFNSQMTSFLADYGDRISKLHFSVPQSNSGVYTNYKEESTAHFLYTQSDFDFLDTLVSFLPSHVDWVIEGLIPLSKAELLEEELNLINEVLRPLPEVASAAD